MNPVPAAAAPAAHFQVADGCLVKYTGQEAHVRIPGGINAIGENAFSGNRKLRSVSIPDSVVWIGKNAFSQCLGLEKVRLPRSLKVLDDRTFYCCFQLRQIQLPESLLRIGTNVFTLTSLEELIVPDSVTTINSMAFNLCKSLERIYIPASVQVVDTYNGVDQRFSANSVFSGCPHVTIFTPRNSVAARYAAYYNIPCSHSPYSSAKTTTQTSATTWNPASHCLLASKKAGILKQLRGRVLITVFHVNDASSCWTSLDVAAYRRTHERAVQNLTREAARRGICLQIQTAYHHLSTTKECTFEDPSWAQTLKQQCLVTRPQGYDEAPVILALNKPLRSFAYMADRGFRYYHDAQDEFCVVAQSRCGFEERTIQHELFHLFGAPDLYYPSDVKYFAEKHLPESIMNSGYEIDNLTAYAIGWTDTLSKNALDFLYATRHHTYASIQEALKHA